MKLGNLFKKEADPERIIRGSRLSPVFFRIVYGAQGPRRCRALLGYAKDALKGAGCLDKQHAEKVSDFLREGRGGSPARTSRLSFASGGDISFVLMASQLRDFIEKETGSTVETPFPQLVLRKPLGFSLKPSEPGLRTQGD